MKGRLNQLDAPFKRQPLRGLLRGVVSFEFNAFTRTLLGAVGQIVFYFIYLYKYYTTSVPLCQEVFRTFLISFMAR